MSEDNVKITYYGEVVWFDPKRGYGFIFWEIDGVKQKDLFVHFSDVSCEGFKTLYKGQKVKFGLGINKHGDPKATSVEIMKN
jgi:CspA family cold shock protein